MFKGELAKFCKHDGRVGCFLHPEQGLEEPSIHYFNNFYFFKVHPNLTSITYCGRDRHVEKVTM
jgi:hypothetical protein